MSPQIRRKILITGHPRSGTGYMAALFQANGYDVGHECMGTDGTSNWQFAVCAAKYPFAIDEWRRQDVIFEKVIQVIRHPLHAINSIAATEWGSDNFRASFVPLCGNKWERAIMSYYGWNMIISAQAPDQVIALEHASASLNFTNDTAPVNQREHEILEEYDIKRQCNAVVWEYYICLADIYKKLLPCPSL